MILLSWVCPPWEMFCKFLHILSIQAHFHTKLLKNKIFPYSCQANRLLLPIWGKLGFSMHHIKSLIKSVKEILCHYAGVPAGRNWLIWCEWRLSELGHCQNSVTEQAALSAISASMLLPHFHFLLLLRHFLSLTELLPLFLFLSLHVKFPVSDRGSCIISLYCFHFSALFI